MKQPNEQKLQQTQQSLPPLAPDAPQGSIGSQGAISPLTGQQTSSNEATKRAATAADSSMEQLTLAL
jgi:hypothetical protein